MAKNTIIPFGYDRATVKPGIVHIGTGRSHRAVETFYTNEVLRYPDQRHWGICTIFLSAAERDLYTRLSANSGLYTLTALAPDGRRNCFEIGAIVRLIYAPDNPEKAIDALADPDTRIISLNLSADDYNTDSPQARHDAANPAASPQSVFGYVAEGLRRRIKSGGRPVTILSCDDIPRNGDTASKAFLRFFETQDPSLALWAESNVTFPNSVADRLSPALSDADIRSLNDRNGTVDAAPVLTEEYCRWIVEDRFADGRPAWERAGVIFTDDITAYAEMKQNIIDGSVAMLSFPAFLAGFRKASQALKDPAIARFINGFLQSDAVTQTTTPSGYKVSDEAKNTLDRLSNGSLAYPLAQLCADSALKLRHTLLPLLMTLTSASDSDISRLAFLLAAYRHYLHYQTDDNGESFTAEASGLDEEDRKLIISDNPDDFLRISPLAAAKLTSDARFVKAYRQMVSSIADSGAMATLKSIVG